jgi:hypothetical protein
MRGASLLRRLRRGGASVHSEGDRLVVEAPPGLVTAELRAELVECKADLLVMLNANNCGNEGPSVSGTRRAIAALLATAYRRCATIQSVGRDQTSESVNTELAISDGQSVHGVVE